MAVSVTYTTNVTTNETIDTNAPAAAASKSVIIHDQYNTTASLDSTTTPPVTKSVYFSQALSAGTATIDLTSLTGVNNLVTDGTGLKVQVIKFKNPTGNAQIEVDVGATNGYNLLGATFEVILLEGQEIAIYGNDSTPDIGASAKDIDLVGTGTEEIEVSVVMG